MGESINAFIYRAINETMEQEKDVSEAEKEFLSSVSLFFLLTDTGTLAAGVIHHVIPI